MSIAAETEFHAHADRLQMRLGTGLRARLRAATAPAHGRIDRAFGVFNLRTAAGYRGFLEASAAALLPLEAALVDAEVARIFPDWARRSRRQAILDDLARIGGEACPLPELAPLDPDRVLGTMYVLEGSRLGAKVLVKQVADSPYLHVATATAYLRHGADGRLWHSFVAALERHAATADETAVIDGARQAFALFERAVVRDGRVDQAPTSAEDRRAFA